MTLPVKYTMTQARIRKLILQWTQHFILVSEMTRANHELDKIFQRILSPFQLLANWLVIITVQCNLYNKFDRPVKLNLHSIGLVEACFIIILDLWALTSIFGYNFEQCSKILRSMRVADKGLYIIDGRLSSYWFFIYSTPGQRLVW